MVSAVNRLASSVTSHQNVAAVAPSVTIMMVVLDKVAANRDVILKGSDGTHGCTLLASTLTYSNMPARSYLPISKRSMVSASSYVITNTMSIYSPVSPSNTYVIYDQYGDFISKSHLEVSVRGWKQAVEQYRFYKEFNPGRSIGLCTKEYYDNKKKSYQRPTPKAIQS